MRAMYTILILIVLHIIVYSISIFPQEPIKAIVSMIVAIYLIALLIGKLNQKK